MDDYPIHLAIHKYGEKNFNFEILEEDLINYNEREIYWIEYYNSLAPNGYNIQSGGTINLILKGEDSPRSTISNEVRENIIELLLYSNLSQRKIAETCNTTETIVNKTNAGETYKKEELNYPLRPRFCHYSQKTLEEIFWLLSNSEASYESIAKYYNLTKGNIAQINRGDIHRREDITYPIRNYQGVPIPKIELAKILSEKRD